MPEYSSYQAALLGKLMDSFVGPSFQRADGGLKRYTEGESVGRHKLKLIRKAGLGESCWVWTKGEIVTVEIIDNAWGRPVQAQLFRTDQDTKQGKGTVVFPTVVVDNSYALERDFRYPGLEGIPFSVIAGTIETWDCTPRGKKAKRVGLEVMRTIFDKPDKRITITPFKLISLSTFMIAPESIAGQFGEINSEVWVEAERRFETKRKKFCYKLNASGRLVFAESEAVGARTGVGALPEDVEPQIRLVHPKRSA